MKVVTLLKGICVLIHDDCRGDDDYFVSLLLLAVLVGEDVHSILALNEYGQLNDFRNRNFGSYLSLILGKIFLPQLSVNKNSMEH